MEEEKLGSLYKSETSVYKYLMLAMNEKNTGKEECWEKYH